MDKLSNMSVYIKVVEMGSFTAVANLAQIYSPASREGAGFYLLQTLEAKSTDSI